MLGGDSPIRLLVLDVLKPHKPDIVELGKAINALKSVEGTNISVTAVDEKTESLKVTIEGKNIEFEEVKKTIGDFGAVIHSTDKVILGKLCSGSSKT